MFKEYINYFQDKKRAGVVTIRNIILYLVPPCEEINEYYKINDNEILGLLCDVNSKEEFNEGGILCKRLLKEEENEKNENLNVKINDENIKTENKDINIENDEENKDYKGNFILFFGIF